MTTPCIEKPGLLYLQELRLNLHVSDHMKALVVITDL